MFMLTIAAVGFMIVRIPARTSSHASDASAGRILPRVASHVLHTLGKQTELFEWASACFCCRLLKRRSRLRRL
jgi:hypothetical protein